MMHHAPAHSAGRVAAKPVFVHVAGRPHLALPRCQRAQLQIVSAAGVNAGPEGWSKSYYPSKADAACANKEWFIIDAEGQTLGRLATLAATYIRGKHAATYTPSMDMGAYVVVVNADKVKVTGNKFNDKTYFRHPTARPGTAKFESFKDLQKRLPERIIEKAVKGMLPKGPLGKEIFHHLKVYKGTEHPHSAQQPVDITSKINKNASELANRS